MLVYSRIKKVFASLLLCAWAAAAALSLLCASSAEAAYISKVKGWVGYKAKDSASYSQLKDDAEIRLGFGDAIITRRASSVRITMDDGSIVNIGPMSSFVLTVEKRDSTRLELLLGKMRSKVTKKANQNFQVRTPAAVCAVRGTDFTVAVENGGQTRVEVHEGVVAASNQFGAEVTLNAGQFTNIAQGAVPAEPKTNTNPTNMDAGGMTDKATAMREVYQEISKQAVLAEAQAEIQTAEYQNHKVAIDGYGQRVRMEEYIVRPEPDRFKYVVLNTRDNRFDFGKILFIFNKALPEDLTLATKTMSSATGSTAPEWQLTDLSSVMSNTTDKVVEEATGGTMVADDPNSPTSWSLFFANYSFYVNGNNSTDNGGKGTLFWSFSDTNGDNKAQSSEYTYLGGTTPTELLAYPDGENVFHTVMKNTYATGAWIQAEDFVLFDDGKKVSPDELASRAHLTMTEAIAQLNFQRVYTSSLFGGRKIDLAYSAKLLSDAGLLRLAE